MSVLDLCVVQHIGIFGFQCNHREVLFVGVDVFDYGSVELAIRQKVIPSQFARVETINNLLTDECFSIRDTQQRSGHAAAVVADANLHHFVVKYDGSVDVDNAAVFLVLHVGVQFHRVIGDAYPTTVDENLDFVEHIDRSRGIQRLDEGFHVSV